MTPIHGSRSTRRHAETAPGARDVRYLTLLIVVLIAIPSILIVGPLGAAGTPADLIGIGMLAVWGFRRLAIPTPGRRSDPVETALLGYVAAVVVSYFAAAVRPIAGVELSAADRGMLATLAWFGMAVFAANGPQSFTQLDTVLRRLTIAGAVEAAVGITQFATNLSLTNMIAVPGLRANSDLASTLASRGDLARPAGTTIHPIEFGAVLTLILPIAIHYALMDRDRSRIARFCPVVLIAFAIPISISRSAILSALVALAFLLPTWPRALRRKTYLTLVALAASVYLTIPGLLGTLQHLFTGISSDSSAASRRDSYALAEQMISRAPWFGRGFGTFLPEYRILDNQFLGTTIEMGVVGLLALTVLVATPVVACLKTRRTIPGENRRHLAQALAAAVAAAACSFALYDALSFPMAASMFFLAVGFAEAFVRLVRAERAAAPYRSR